MILRNKVIFNQELPENPKTLWNRFQVIFWRFGDYYLFLFFSFVLSEFTCDRLHEGIWQGNVFSLLTTKGRGDTPARFPVPSQDSGRRSFPEGEGFPVSGDQEGYPSLWSRDLPQGYPKIEVLHGQDWGIPRPGHYTNSRFRHIC